MRIGLLLNPTTAILFALLNNSAIFSASPMGRIECSKTNVVASVSRCATVLPETPADPTNAPVRSRHDPTHPAVASVAVLRQPRGTPARANGNTTGSLLSARRSARIPDRHTVAHRAKSRAHCRAYRPPTRTASPHLHCARDANTAACADTTSASPYPPRHTSPCSRQQSLPPAAQTSAGSRAASPCHRGPQPHHAG